MNSRRTLGIGMTSALVALAIGTRGPVGYPARLQAAVEASTPAAPFMTAIVEQLGLKLESAKAVVDILVVDKFNKTPTEN